MAPTLLGKCKKTEFIILAYTKGQHNFQFFVSIMWFAIELIL